MLPGFVTIGRTELLLSVFTVALLMVLLGFMLGYLVRLTHRPKPIRLRALSAADQRRADELMRKACHGLHCDDGPELAAWLKRKDFRLVTNEVLTGMQTEIARHRTQARCAAPKVNTSDPG